MIELDVQSKLEFTSSIDFVKTSLLLTPQLNFLTKQNTKVIESKTKITEVFRLNKVKSLVY